MPQVWTRLECDAPGAATMPAGASALGSSTGQTYEESALPSYSYNDAEADSGSGAGVDLPADAKVTDVELLLIGTASVVAFVVVLSAAALFFRCRTLARGRQAKRNVEIAKPTVPASAAAADAECRTESFESTSSSVSSSV